MPSKMPRLRATAIRLRFVPAFLCLWGPRLALPSEGPSAIGEDSRPAAPHAPEAAGRAEWVRSGLNAEGPKWGIRGALVWGLPAGLRPADGPRGLIRLWYPTLPGGREDLINFIAIEPVVAGKRGFSELERSRLDDVQGLRLEAEGVGSERTPSPGREGKTPAGKLQPESESRGREGLPERRDRSSARWPAGELRSLPSGAESLSVLVRVERFENGAHVYLLVAQRSDAPEELGFTIRAEPDGAPLEACILTATMGNKARARQLWLADRVVTSQELYPGYREDGFAPHAVFKLERLRRTEAGEVLVAITTDEENPAAVDPYPARPHWRYCGFPVTQYWKKPAGAWCDDLCVAVNARFTYWLSRQPIPGGVAFENFEMRERFYDGQRFVFGITRKPPAELGFAR